MQATIESVKAKRGDLVVIHCKDRGYVIGQGSYEHDRFTVGRVTSITREGMVKGYQEIGYGGSFSDHKIDLKSYRQRDKPIGFVKLYVTSQDRIDVEAALEAARNNKWHGGTAGKAFDSLAAVKAALTPCLRQS